MWVSTFHAFCARLLRVHAEKLGYKREFTIYDGADQVRLVKRCIVELGKDPKRFNPRSFAAQISAAKNVLMTPDDYLRSTEGYIAENVGRGLRPLPDAPLREQRDGLRRPHHADRRAAGGLPEVRERYQTRFKYIHVDEYQDTNHASTLGEYSGRRARNYAWSVMMISRCTHGEERTSGTSWTSSATTGGEGRQAGAELPLDQTILDAANAVVANNASRKAKELWTAGDEGERIRVFAASTSTRRRGSSCPR
jgi:DNA helicase-2/ATP-dependent DNA helicase PcrA